ncbi:protein moonraker isoform X2 [Nerophis ophidion]|uniref:protein moonraker isoform X2 n=1 Tax=Nerophis ophidion TaxID=159077 RepID=UPI002AE09DE4|nr:protein moonraker isoform X2 [Nerophis ophidion]
MMFKSGSMISLRPPTNSSEWIVRPSPIREGGFLSAGASQTKLLFNEAVPTCLSNRATVVGPPGPIVIEKLLPFSGALEKADSIKSLLSFSSLSEEKLQAAVYLAKRDLRRQRFNAMYKSPVNNTQDASILNKSDAALHQEIKTRPGSKHPVHTTKKRPVVLLPTARHPVSRPMGGANQHVVLRKEIRMLQNELENLKKDRACHVKPKERVKVLAARQGTSRKPFMAFGGQPYTVQEQREAARLQNVCKQEFLALHAELKPPDSACIQSRESRLSGGCTSKQCAEDTNRPRIACKLAWTQDSVLRPPETVGQRGLLNQEMHTLDKELETMIQLVGKLSERGKAKEQLEPDEQKKFEVRCQKQAVRSARSIYTLQQQIRETQQYMEKLHNQDMWDAKKSTAIQRLTSAHRGTLKVLRVIVVQLSEQCMSQLPSHCKELSRLICQLSLCTAKIQVESGSAMPKTAVDILQKLELLDSAISKQEMLLQKKRTQNQAGPLQKKSNNQSVSPPRAPKGLSRARGPPNATNPTRRSHVCSQRMTAHKQRGLQGPAQQKVHTSENESKKEGALQHEKNKSPQMLGNQKQNAHFKQPTVSSRLRVNQPPHREPSVPWIPASSHSLSPPRSHQKMSPEPKCLWSPPKPSSSVPVGQKDVLGSVTVKDADLSLEKKEQAQSEALRGVWLEKTTMQRLNELNQLSEEEVERIRRLRTEVMSPTQWAERAEQQAREKIQPLLDEAKHLGESRSRSSVSLRNKLSEPAAKTIGDNAEQLGEVLLDELLEDAAQAAWTLKISEQWDGVSRRAMQAPTLESMLLRMEEIQKDQEEVRRRFTSIAYSEPDQLEQQAGSQVQVSGSRPNTPQPIRLTRLVLRQPEAADIVLEKPVETSILSESSLTEEAPQDQQPANRVVIFPGPKEQSARTVISVPGSVLRSIRRYRDDYDTYLCDVAHDPGGGLNSWSIADRLFSSLCTCNNH